jgi:glucan phosphoethanolaminetransferase (alkaline phosphatase superfamily)
MQPLEFSLVLAGTLGTVLLLALSARKTKWLIFLPLILCALAGTQLYVEGYRWHMLAAYIGIALIIAVIVFSSRLTSRLLRILAVFSFLCFAASTVAASSFPIF